MRWKRLNSHREVWISDKKYLIDWDKSAPSKGAQAVKDFLRDHLSNHLVFEEYCLPCTGRLRVDFLIPGKKIAIEYDGEQHEKYNSHFHKTRGGFINSLRRDELKDQFLEWNGYKVIRIVEKDLSKLSKEWLAKEHEVYI